MMKEFGVDMEAFHSCPVEKLRVKRGRKYFGCFITVWKYSGLFFYFTPDFSDHVVIRIRVHPETNNNGLQGRRIHFFEPSRIR